MILKSILHKIEINKTTIMYYTYYVFSSITTPVSFKFQLLQLSPEGDSNLPTNYGTIDLNRLNNLLYH